MFAKSLSRRSLLAFTGAGAVIATSPARAQTRGSDRADVGLWHGVAFEDKDGRTFQLRDGSARLMLVTMWAHWCPACLSELPSLAGLSAALGSQLDVLLLSHPEYWRQDQVTAKRWRIPHRMATLSSYNKPEVIEAVLLQDGAYAVPRSLLFRRNETVAWTHAGSVNWASADTIGRVRALA